MINVDLLNEMIEKGYVNTQKHSELDLHIYNYSKSCAYDKIWNEVTLMCRGLILDSDYNIVARPFPKFFNLEEHDSNDIVFSKPFTLYDKLDGSLLISFWSHDGPAVATRGSFASDQAIMGTKILRESYGDFRPLEGITYLFEFIHPENRIVVDYGDMKDIVLLATISNETGADLDDENHWSWPGPVVRKYDISCKPQDVVAELNPKDDGSVEGYVLRFDWPEGQHTRVKVKLEEYKRLHRILTGVSNKMVWQYLMEERSFDDLLENVPDEFNEWVRLTAQDLTSRFETRMAELKDKFRATLLSDERLHELVLSSCTFFPVTPEQRKIFAELVKDDPDRGYLFMLLSAHTDRLRTALWRELKPTYSRPFTNNDEESS